MSGLVQVVDIGDPVTHWHLLRAPILDFIIVIQTTFSQIHGNHFPWSQAATLDNAVLWHADHAGL